ncbi:Charged multivesicular body protein 6 [[Candida] zeylanoides]
MGQTSSTPRITPQDRAVFQLKQQRDKLRQHQTKLAAVVERHTALARRALAQGHPERARFYLRAKQHQQSTIAKTYAQLDTLEQLIGTIEFKSIEKDVLEGLRQGNAVLRELNREMSVERIEAVLDDLEEERVKVEEASEVLGRGLTRGEENEVEEEMARLAAEASPQTPQAAVQAPQAAAPAAADLPRVPPLPMAPTGELEDAEEETSREEAAREKAAREEAPVAA